MTYTFPYDRRKLLVLTLVTVAAAMVMGGGFVVLFIGEGEAAEVLRETAGVDGHTGATALLFSTFAVAAGLCFMAARYWLRTGPVLTVDEQGILDRRLGRHVPWCDVRAVELRGKGVRAVFAISLHPEVGSPGTHRRRRKGAEVRVNVGALRCRAEDVALAIQACGGYPVIHRS